MPGTDEMTARQFADLSEVERDKILRDAMAAREVADYTVGRLKAGEAAALIREMFPGARWVGFDQDQGDLDGVSTTIHLIRTDAGGTLFDLDVDEEMPDSAPEDYLSGAAEAGVDFRERGDLLWFDVIEVA